MMPEFDFLRIWHSTLSREWSDKSDCCLRKDDFLLYPIKISFLLFDLISGWYRHRSTVIAPLNRLFQSENERCYTGLPDNSLSNSWAESWKICFQLPNCAYLAARAKFSWLTISMSTSFFCKSICAQSNWCWTFNWAVGKGLRLCV
jgi:hypothetical protein